VFEAVTAAAESWVGLQIDNTITHAAPDADPEAEKARYISLQHRMMAFLVVTELIGQGQVVQVDSTHREIATVTLNTEAEITTVLQNPAEYRIKGTDRQVWDVIGSMLATPDMDKITEHKN
jgi:hypothetical protein